jgi:MFS family permease
MVVAHRRRTRCDGRGLPAGGLLIGPLLGSVRYALGLPATGLAIVLVAQLAAVASGFAGGYLLGRRAPAAVTGSALVLMLLGVVAAALAGSAAMLTVAVLPAGLGQGAALGTGAGLTGEAGERRAQVRLGLGLALFGALAVGALLGWFATRSLSWRLACLATVPSVLVALLATVVIAVATSARGTRAP